MTIPAFSRAPASRRDATRLLPPALALALAACGGGGGDDGGGSAASARTAALTGLYVQPVAASVGDELYLEIDGRARLKVWNHLGDAFDAGPDCHLESPPIELVPRGGDRYALEVDDEGLVEDLGGVLDERLDEVWTLYREGEALVIVFPDEYDQDADGDTEDLFEQRFPVASGLDASDFELCTDAQFDAFVESRSTRVPDAGLADPARPGRVPRLDPLERVRRGAG